MFKRRPIEIFKIYRHMCSMKRVSLFLALDSDLVVIHFTCLIEGIDPCWSIVIVRLYVSEWNTCSFYSLKVLIYPKLINWNVRGHYVLYLFRFGHGWFTILYELEAFHCQCTFRWLIRTTYRLLSKVHLSDADNSNSLWITKKLNH